jgi:hypothetical protein
MSSEIDKWNELTNQITEQWIRDYFNIEEGEDLDYYYIADDIGGVFEFADMFISFQNVLDCYKHKISKEKFHEWYDWCLENYPVNISLAKFLLSPEEKAKKEQKHLSRLKERVIFAEEEFNKALSEYDKKEKLNPNCSCGVFRKKDGEHYCEECLKDNPFLCT